METPIFDLASFKKAFDPLLEEAISSRIKRAPVFSNDAYVLSLLEYVKELALAGGKRVRPYVAYLMYKTAGGEDENILEVLVAIELFHVFALIHDDIIDRGAVRHGIPTMHEYARTLRASAHAEGARVAESQALLVGDLVFNWSKEILTEKLESACAKEAQKIFNDMVYAVVLGQMLDVKMVDAAAVTLQEIEEKTLLKTAQYTFIYPLRFGAALAGHAGEYDEWSTTFGTALGIAFQLQDDLLDIIGEEERMGKKPLKDIAEGQHTIFTAYVQEHGSEAEREALSLCFGKECSEKSAKSIREIFEHSGAVLNGRTRIKNEMKHAQNALGSMNFSSEATHAWQELLIRMNGRAS